METQDILFKVWCDDINEKYGAAKFASINRREILTELCQSLAEKQIEYSIAFSLKKEVGNYLVTNQAKKTARGKTWISAVEQDFQVMLFKTYDRYGLKPSTKESDRAREKITNSLPPELAPVKKRKHPIITAWAEKRYGDKLNPVILELAHKIGSDINKLFQEEVFKSTWARGMSEPPEWAKPHLSKYYGKMKEEVL